jgi:hypothetical protein
MDLTRIALLPGNHHREVESGEAIVKVRADLAALRNQVLDVPRRERAVDALHEVCDFLARKLDLLRRENLESPASFRALSWGECMGSP